MLRPIFEFGSWKRILNGSSFLAPHLTSPDVGRSVRSKWGMWFLALVLLAPVQGLCAEESDVETVKALGSAIVELKDAVGEGRFGAALQAHRRALQISHLNQLTDEYDEGCSGDCPQFIGHLAWLAGAERSELSFLDEIVNAIEDPEARAAWERYVHVIAHAHLAEGDRSDRSPDDVLPLDYHYEDFGDHRPWTHVQVGDPLKTYLAIIDTGRAGIHFGQELAQRHSLKLDALEESFTTAEWDGRAARYRRAILHDFVLGDVREERVFAAINELDGFFDGVMILGTMPLLRHDVICFSWEDRVLYMGRLGPCVSSERAAPYGDRLHSRYMAPVVDVKLPDGRVVQALIDTGSDANLCKESLRSRYPDTHLPFGRHELLTARCSPSTPAISEGYIFDMVVGMETLWSFSAFGWELDPFRMYFVPRGAEPREDISPVVRSNLDELKNAAERGDFQAAFRAHRRAWRFALAGGPRYEEYERLCTDICPYIGKLAWLVGAAASEFDFLGGYVRSIEDDDIRKEWEDYVHWVALGHVGKRGSPERSTANSLPLRYQPGDAEDGLYWTPVRISPSEKSVWAVLGTGVPNLSFGENFALEQAISYEPLGELSSTVDRDGNEAFSRLVSLERIEIGELEVASAHGRMTAEADAQDGGDPVLGVLSLLRHDAVCFDWQGLRVHLGELGPCSVGGRLEARRGLVHSTWLVPLVEVRTMGGEVLPALVDTGSAVNRCKESLNAADRPVSFGDSPVLSATCNPDAVPIDADYEFDMVIGMETLGQFSAFGWELNPFRMYFVPKGGSD